MSASKHRASTALNTAASTSDICTVPLYFPGSPLHSFNDGSTVLTNVAVSNNNPSSQADNDDDDEEDDDEDAAEEEEDEEEEEAVFLLVPRAGGCMAPGIRVAAPTLRSSGRMSPGWLGGWGVKLVGGVCWGFWVSVD